MSEELNQVVKAMGEAQAEPQDELTTDSLEEDMDTQDVQENVTEESPYKAMYEQMQESRDREKESRQYERQKRRELQEENEQLKTSQVDKDGIKELIQAELSSAIDPYMKQLHKNQLKTAIIQLSSDKYEQELIEEAYHNRIKLSGNLELDLIDARALVNSRLSEKEGEARVKAAYAKKYAASQSKGGLTGVKKEPKSEEPVLTKEEKAFLEVVKKQSNASRGYFAKKNH